MEQKFYLSVDRSKQLKHWKYIKKVRRNGRWVYYYDAEKLKDDLGFDEREARDEAQRKYETSRLKSYVAEQNLKKGYAEGKSVTGYGLSMDEKSAIVKRADEIYKATNKETVNLAKEYAAASRKYANTPLGKLESFINKGARFLEKIFG